MRPLNDVITAMQNILKDDKYEQLRKRLDSILDSLNYAAPEAIPMWWQQTSNILGYELEKLGPCQEIQTVSDIFNAKEDYKKHL